MYHQIGFCCVLLSLLVFCIYPSTGYNSSYSYLRVLPTGCDETAALQCEYDFLICKLFNGPANDAKTLCDCAKQFYGSCIREAGCETAKEVGPLTQHEIYMKTCVDFIMTYNCPDPLICGINCASNDNIDKSTTKIIPFNNYGQYYLRIRTCLLKIREQRLSRYSLIQQGACSAISDYEVCSRWIPPSTFVPVALPINTTYVAVDSCIITKDIATGARLFECLDNPAPVIIYGNRFLFPRSYDVPQTSNSTCASNSK